MDCGPTSHIPCALLRKQSLVSSAHPKEISGTTLLSREAAAAKKNAAYKKTLQSAAKRLSRVIERREGKGDAFSEARRWSVKTLRCIDVGITLENSIKRLSV